MRNIVIDDAVFKVFPTFFRAVAIASVATNEPDNPPLLASLAGAVCGRIGMDVDSHPAIQSWDHAYRLLGSKPNKHPPSVKALLKRAAAGKAVPFINSAVAIFNLISIKRIIPCGGDDIAATHGDLVLGISDGSETFVPLGNPDRVEHPDRGEVIYFDRANKNVMCRRWNWRNSDTTKILSSTRDLVINVDCLPPLDCTEALLARNEIGRLLEEHCCAKVTYDFLNRDRKEVRFSSA